MSADAVDTGTILAVVTIVANEGDRSRLAEISAELAPASRVEPGVVSCLGAVSKLALA
jgi:quinol monooxygenase YgiN